ncbi:hypothetical protein Hbal_2654 [Hirschia baltica ATCC 49814]|uniref:Uncharacterized protein n=1 Tax=Hirschia baltica (strain ATCC 49814 / DSM 5838 / IFAM 1418) TaxID=582402 RepID=C6XPR4_HIRBI|nr:hypothetical protein Hbal_2654 [Hirschia baltica ATCC 49814]
MKTRQEKPSALRRLRGIFGIPFALFVLSFVGLISALMIDGWLDILASLAVGSSLAAILWARFG